MADAGDLERILQFRERFILNGLRLTGGRGLPRSCQDPRATEPDLVTTTLALPDVFKPLDADARERLLLWITQRQEPTGAFLPHESGTILTAGCTAAVFHGLVELHRVGIRDTRITHVRASAGRWLVGHAAASEPLSSATPPEVALMLQALAEFSRLSRDPGALRPLRQIIDRARDRFSRTSRPADRLWYARGLIEVFHQQGEIAHHELVADLVEVLSKTQDQTGRVAADIVRPGGPRADTLTQALFVCLACQVGIPDYAVRTVQTLTQDLMPSGMPRPLQKTQEDSNLSICPISSSDTQVGILIHDALVKFCGAAMGIVQIPLLTADDPPPDPRPRRRSASGGAVPRVVFLTRESPEHACPFVRVHAPLTALAKGGAIDYRVGSTTAGRYVVISEPAVRAADIVVMQRYFASPAFGLVMGPLLKRSRTAVVYEIDDLLFDLPPDHPGYVSTTGIGSHIESTLRNAVVTTTCDTLAQHLYERGASQVLVIPNAIDPDHWPAMEPGTPPDRRASERRRPLVIGCTGSNTHGPDLQAVLPAVREILSRHAGRVEFLFWGCVPEELADTPGVRTDSVYLESYRAYARRLCSLQIDLALVPLADNAFNQAKSYIKWLEYSAAGVPGIYARVGPYPRVIRHGEDGLLAGEDTHDWVSQIETLVEKADRRLEIAANAYRRVRRDFTFESTRPLWEMVIDLATRSRTDGRTESDPHASGRRAELRLIT